MSTFQMYKSSTYDLNWTYKSDYEDMKICFVLLSESEVSAE